MPDWFFSLLKHWKRDFYQSRALGVQDLTFRCITSWICEYGVAKSLMRCSATRDFLFLSQRPTASREGMCLRFMGMCCLPGSSCLLKCKGTSTWREHAFLNLVLMENIFDLNSLVAVCVSLNRYTACLAQHNFSYAWGQQHGTVGNGASQLWQWNKWGDWAGRARIMCYVRWLRNTLPTMGSTWQTIDKSLFVGFQCVSVAFVQDDWPWFVYQCNSGSDSAAAIAVRCCRAHVSFRTAPATLFASLRGYVLSERLVLQARACTARGGTNPSGNNGESDKFSSCATNISQCFSAPWIPPVLCCALAKFHWGRE